MAAKLSTELLFSTKTTYGALNGIEKTKDTQLLVLKHPCLPLHNNGIGGKVEKRRQDVSLHTISEAGTTAKDSFLTIVAKKLGVNIFDPEGFPKIQYASII